MKKMITLLAALLCCTVMMSVLTACSENDDNSSSEGNGSIVGNWYTDVSGKTSAKWNYEKTWQNTEFKADGTGCTRIYYTYQDEPIGIEKIDFTFTTANGVLTMTPQGREVSQSKWLLQGEELRLGDNQELTFKKTTTEMAAKFDTWSKDKDVMDVPQPARHTVFVYGNAAGQHDFAIEEGFWEKAKKFLTDYDNVRVVCFYKYGKDQPAQPFSGKYAQPGDIVWFELTSETDLNKIKEDGFQAHGLGGIAKLLQLCNPNTMRLFLEYSSLACPAEKYSLAIWGHGSGFDALKDVPDKYEVSDPTPAATRGVMIDEWIDNEWMDMYEMYDAVKAAGFDRLNTLFFHNCFMGNIESLTQIRGIADYIVASSHMLYSEGDLLTEFVRGLMDKGNAEEAVRQMFERVESFWPAEYSEGDAINNGDYKMIRTDKFDAIIDASKRLCDRIMALYPTQQEAIDRATRQVYRYYMYYNIVGMNMEYYMPFFDIADYARQLAKETGDDEMKAVSAAMDKAFGDAFVHWRDINNGMQHLDHYSLSVCLMSHDSYVYDYKTNRPNLHFVDNYNEGYEKCDFHKLTGWGNWLNMNKQLLNSNPQNGGGGKLEKQ